MATAIFSLCSSGHRFKYCSRFGRVVSSSGLWRYLYLTKGCDWSRVNGDIGSRQTRWRGNHSNIITHARKIWLWHSNDARAAHMFTTGMHGGGKRSKAGLTSG